MKRSRSTTTRVTLPAATRPRASLTETENFSRRPSTFSSLALAVTVEPCTMCAGALVMARVSGLVFGAWEPKTGAVGSLWDVVRDRRLTHRPRVRGGVLEKDCAALLEDFFRGRRDAGQRDLGEADSHP